VNGHAINGARDATVVSLNTNGKINGNARIESSAAKLKDQRKLTLKDNLELFISSTTRLSSRLRNGEMSISFDKDDDDTLDFVTATSNLRSAAYGIEGKTRWEVKEMAGNIIPAIATTNAVIAGLIVLQALHLLRKSHGGLRNVHIQLKPSVPLSAVSLSRPNIECGVCRDTYTTVLCDPARTLLGDIVKGILGDDKREVSVFEDKRVLSDPDWDDNYERTLEGLNVTQGKFLTIVDEEGEVANIAMALSNLPPNHQIDACPYILPSPLPKPPKKAKRPVLVETPPRKSLKRPLPTEDENGVIDLEPTPKRVRVQAGLDSRTSDKDLRKDSISLGSPGKRRRLEDDGFLIVDGTTDTQENDVIEID